jgi:hypothetical protein
MIAKACWLIVAATGLSAPAWAYIDPAAGSALFQALAAIVIGVGAFWHRIVDAVRRRFRRNARSAPPTRDPRDDNAEGSR